MKKHIALWNRIWLPFCAANGVTDPTAWAPVQAANCLTEHQENYIDRTETAGDRKPQHHVYKELRAALGACPTPDPTPGPTDAADAASRRASVAAAAATVVAGAATALATAAIFL